VKPQARYLSLHEYISQQLMQDAGIRVPRGGAAKTAEEAKSLAESLGGQDWVVKAQILAGGRGKGTFDNGFKGGVHVVNGSPQDVGNLAKKMLGHNLITNQSGPQGRPVDCVAVIERFYIRRETYFAIAMDRANNGPVIVASAAGGMDIEAVAHETPDAIIRIPVDINKGITTEQCAAIADKLGFVGKNRADAMDQFKKLYDLFITRDATLLEINPLVETHDGTVLCLDAKLNFDDNALFRHKDLDALRDWSQEDPREVAAAKFDLNYIGLDGTIACLVNGAGLAMATMDMIKLKGGEPANFLDVGGSANERQVTEAFKILNGDERVSVILVNIFGGIMRCDVIASGIINAAKELNLQKPLIVRLQGTNVAKAKELIDSCGLRIIPADDLDQAATQSVKIAKIREMAAEANLSVSFELPL
jgi:succinyl-CoA synthetase beta subunit